MTIRFPTGFGVRINLTAALNGPQVYYPEPLLDLLPAGTCWAHWSPRNLGHTAAGWSPCAAMFGGAVHPKEALLNVESGALFLLGNDMEQGAVRAGTDTVKAAARRHADQLAVLREWALAGDLEYAWAGPQWNVNPENLGLVGDWFHEMRQHQGYARSGHRLAIHLYGAWDAASFWSIIDDFEMWRADKLPEVPVIVTEFSGWPGTTLEQQIEVMTAGFEYLQSREYVEWVAWFSGYRFANDAGRSWGTELAEVSEAGSVVLTALGEHFVGLAL